MTKTAAVEREPGYETRRFVIENGDGYSDLVRRRLILERVRAPWFPGRIGEWGPAWLVRVTEGPFAGTLLALTPRGIMPSIEERLAATSRAAGSRGYSGVILHEIGRPGSSFRGDGLDSNAVGQTYMEEFGES